LHHTTADLGISDKYSGLYCKNIANMLNM